ncbi:DMT family transporter [Yoonia sp. 208BN28-4]|uniref:DMT family transporter n=1 Tax=Yoonia sp. 208BN28-4 TaxID=3126505 RepID=UPI0030B619CC
MEKKSQIDVFGAVALTGFALLLAFNQVVIKVTNGGFQPIFFAGLRSLGAAVCVYAWMRYRGIPLGRNPRIAALGAALGCVFAFEFTCLFIALDLTAVSRASVIFYSMPLWLALMAHIWLPDDRLTPLKAMGLLCAFAGVAVAILTRPDGVGNIWGDLLALGAAIGWALTALLVKATDLRTVKPEVQLFWQVAVSAPILLVLSLFTGDLIRDLQPIHLAGLAFQIIIVVSAGFIFWLWLLSIYPASGVASFSFLSPVLSVALGWLLLDEAITADLIVALILVAAGIVLINRPVRSRRTSA